MPGMLPEMKAVPLGPPPGLRDELAVIALPEAIRAAKVEGFALDPEESAALAYSIADEMIKLRRQ